MNKENKSKLEALLRKVADDSDLEICGLSIKTSQNPIGIEITIQKQKIMNNLIKLIYLILRNFIYLVVFVFIR